MLQRTRNWVLRVVLLLATTVVLDSARAQIQQEAAPAPPPAEQPKQVDEARPDNPKGDARLDDKRSWLRHSLAQQITSERRLDLMHERVDEMSEDQLDRAIDVQKRKMRKRTQQRKQVQRQRQQAQAMRQNQQLQWMAANLAARMRQQDRWRDGFRDGLWVGRRGHHHHDVVGWAPVVTWFPSGAGIHTHPFVASHGRHLHVGRRRSLVHGDHFHTFDTVAHPHVHHVHTSRQRDTTPRVWYDGLRTRFGVPTGNLHDRF